MSTTTQDPPAPAEQETQPEPTSSRKAKKQQREEQRQQRIDVLAQTMLTTLRQQERTKPPAERRSETQLWQAVRAQAAKDERSQRYRQQAKDTARQAGRTTKAEAKSVLYRNRKQLAPWALAAPYAALGAGGWAAVEVGSGHPVALAAAFCGTALGASMLAWRRWLGRKAPKKFHQRITATMGLLTAWTTLMPLIPNAGQGGMWLSLIVATAYMALPWWREYEHPLPLPEVPEPAAAGTDEGSSPAESLTEEQQFVQRIVADYRSYVATRDLLPGSTIAERAERTAHGFRFQLQLNRGKQTIKTVRNCAEEIGYALDVDPSSIQFDKDQRPGALQTTVLMTIITDPVSNDFDGPTIVYDGGDVFIELGPHSDGMGYEYFHVLSDQLTAEELAAGQVPRGSMHDGFVLGTRGSGKSRFLELVAAGLRKLGIEIWYLDPQEGKSSPALINEADWPMRGVHGTEGAYSNVVELWQAMWAACEVREAEGAAAGELGFQHTAERPAIMVIIDECHQVFSAENPKTGNTFGDDLAEVDRRMRKNGMGLLGGSQSITMNTFGKTNLATVLRDGMCGTNAYILRYGEGNASIVSGYEGQPSGSLPGKGFGYALQGSRPHIRFQARCPADADFQPYLAAYPKATLDQRVQKRIGKAYIDRFAKAESKVEANQSFLDQLDASDDGSTVPSVASNPTASTGNTGAKPSTSAARSAPSSAGSQPASVEEASLDDPLLSPAQRRAMPGQQPAAVATSSGEDIAPAVTGAAAEPTAAEQRVLDLLAEEPQHTPATAGRALGLSDRSARKHLAALASKGWACRDADGAYSAVAVATP
ncbi:hypothetical protein GCM10027174_44920 [Salinifilum aidingensis]